MEPVRSIKAVLEDPRYQAAPAEVKAFYWGAIGLLWEGAERAGKGPRLKRDLVPGAAELVARELASEVRGKVEIGWLTEAWAEASARHERYRAAGKAGGLAKHRSSIARASLEPLASLERCQDSPVISRPDHAGTFGAAFALLPEEDIRVKEKRKTEEPLPGFTAFWRVYPVHKEKPAALEAWKKLHCEAIADLIVAKVELLKVEDSHWLRGFTKYPHRWLKAHGWEDDPVPEPRPAPRHLTADERQLEAIRRSDELFDRLIRGERDGRVGGEEAGQRPGGSVQPIVVGGAHGALRH